MATYAELHAILTDNIAGAQTLREKVFVAGLVAAETIVSVADTVAPWDQTAGAHDQRLKWVDRFLGSPDAVTRELFGIVVAANAGVSQAGILGASDTAIQTNVNESIDSLAANLV